MNDNFFISDNFLRFYKAIRKNFESADEAINAIRNNFVVIKDDLFIGRMYMKINAPNRINSIGIKREAELFRSVMGYEEEPYTFSMEMGDNGDCEVTVYPEKNKHWNDDEKKVIEVFTFMCYNIVGKARTVSVIDHLLSVDVLTGASNSKGFIQHGIMLKKLGLLDSYTAFYLNIKTFKYVNRQAGESFGDQILKEYATIVTEHIGKNGKLARLGGDNFAGLILKDKAEDFIRFIKNIKITKSIENHIKSFTISARVGLYNVTPDDGMNEIMTNISTAYNYAKNIMIQDYVWFEPSMLERTMKNRELSFMFPKALKNREFVVYYQPKVSLETDIICGSEALVRWVRDGQLIPPMSFIPLFELDGSVCALDFYVLDTVCADIKDWCDRGIEPVRVSVNFSKNHMRNHELAKEVIEVVEKYGIDPKYLEIELTEMSGYVDYNAMTSFVSAMHEYGISISIDDFGTGYSSLTLLKDLNADVIKLDKSFISNINDIGSDDCTFVKNIINMLSDMELIAVAEGVETKLQADFLSDIHCDVAQGFLFSRPVPHDEYEKKLVDGGKYNRE